MWSFVLGYRQVRVIGVMRSFPQIFLTCVQITIFKLHNNEKDRKYCIVLMGCLLLSNALRLFLDLLCSPNFGFTRTWICRLIFFRGLFFQTWRSLTNLKSQTRDLQLKVPPGRLVLRIFTSWKIHRPHPGLNLLTLDLEASTVLRDHRSQSLKIICFIIKLKILLKYYSEP